MYKLEKKVTDAHSPRMVGSTALEEDASTLKLVYNKYTRVSSTPDSKVRINMVFCHGTGMNKDLWNYHIKQLFKKCQDNPQKHWYLGSVVAIDAVFHGDSALMNLGKVGWTAGWDDGARDVLAVVRHENQGGDLLNNKTSKNVLVGHSLGGAYAILAGFYDRNLFDTIVPIEAVCYYDEKLIPFYGTLFAKVGTMVLDSFDSYEEFHTYYTKKSFYKTLHPEVLKDMVENEYYTVFDPATNTTKYKTKAGKLHQMATYNSALFSLKQIHNSIPLLQVKVCHIVGGNATWNPPDAVPSFLESIDKDALLEHHSIDGTHLINGEHPDSIVDILYGVAAKRSLAAKSVYKNLPEVIYGGDRGKVLDHQRPYVYEGEIMKSVDFSDKTRL